MQESGHGPLLDADRTCGYDPKLVRGSGCCGPTLEEAANDIDNSVSHRRSGCIHTRHAVSRAGERQGDQLGHGGGVQGQEDRDEGQGRVQRVVSFLLASVP